MSSEFYPYTVWVLAQCVCNNLYGRCLYDKKYSSSSDQCSVSTDWINVSNTSIISVMLSFRLAIAVVNHVQSYYNGVMSYYTYVMD